MKWNLSLSLLVIIPGLSAWNARQQPAIVKIAFSRIGTDEKYRLYVDWMKQAAPDIEWIDLGGMEPDRAEAALSGCHGLVLTGGPDIFPGLYGKENEIGKCGKIDRERDAEEIAALRRALGMKIPVLAVCRGAQLLNVVHGGSLIVDIPADYGTLVTHRANVPEGASHEIRVVRGSLLESVSGATTGRVNSFHHQAADSLAPDFTPFAYAPDGIVEAFGWKDPSGKSFLLAVQWHPERMTENRAFSRNLMEIFVAEVRSAAAGR